VSDEKKKRTTGARQLARREAAVAAREGEVANEWERLRYVLLAARMATWEYDIEADAASLSPSAVELFGVASEKAPRTFGDLLMFVHPDDRAHVAEAFALALNPEPSNGPEFRIVWPDGSVHWIENKGRVWRDESGVVRKMLGVIYSIDERKRDEAQKLELERRVQHHQKLESLALLAGGVAHDFNNLLVGILGNASLIAMDLPHDSPLRESVEAIEKSARRAAELVRQMLAYTGRARLVTEPVDLNALVLEMDSLLRAAISHRVAFHFELGKDLRAVNGDATQLRQVVMNLITNAADAIGETDGVITIRSGTMAVDTSTPRDGWVAGELPDGDFCFVEIADTGRGMDATTMARIFDPFFTTKFMGRGLGLAATLGIIRGHRGAIRVTSDPGHGTQFRIAIPRASGPPSAPRPALHDPASDGWRGHGTVLVVDDEEPVRQVAAALLKRVGFDVRAEPDLSRGLETLRRFRDDVTIVLLDRTMPGVDGPAAVDKVRAIAPDTPIVITTGYDELNSMLEYTGKNLAGMLRKPFLAAELNAVMKSALATE
jgi:two-component system cell cycle sensor histidine kinase/response regulator CckA